MMENESTATVELGPTLSCREVPKMAYASGATRAAYKPVSGGMPASEA